MMLATGTKAPDFTLKDQGGKAVSLSDFKGKKVVLYFTLKTIQKGVPIKPNALQNYSRSLQTRMLSLSASVRIRQSLIRILPRNIVCPLPSWRIRIKKLSICTVYGVKRSCTVRP